ncbi:MAG: hypothetical protein Q8K75_04010 [Chlamydiales bacterium]|nr:hypothetical protein [Chlamydiales bacterium]
MNLTTQAHLPAFQPVFQSIKDADFSQKMLKHTATHSIDAAIANLRASRKELVDTGSRGQIKKADRQIRDLSKLRKEVQRSKLTDSESVSRLMGKVTSALASTTDAGSLQLIKNCATEFDRHIATAKDNLTGIKKDYKTTAPKKGTFRRVAALFGKIAGMLKRSPNKNSLSYIEKSAHKLEELIRKQADTPLSNSELKLSAQVANQANLSLLEDHLGLFQQFPHGGEQGLIDRFRANVEMAKIQTKKALEGYQGKGTSQPAKDLEKHIKILENLQELDPRVKSKGEIQRGLANAIVQMEALQSHVQKKI